MDRRTFLAGAAAGTVGAMLDNATTSAAPTPMKVLLWCWDARMTWDDEPDRVQTSMAVSEKPFPYSKRPESYQIGFRRLVDYCAAQGIWGIVIWGFLRDSHGGIDAARDLCLYAQDRGVAILPGVGLCAYGGFYYDGDHPFNLETYLRKHPERASHALEEGGQREVRPVLDPSLTANQQWWRDGLEWMLDAFAIGGVNFEMGDFIVNPSQEARAARTALGFDGNENIKDMIVAARDMVAHGCTLRPDAAFTLALYRGCHQIAGFPATPYVDAMPAETVWQYTLTRMVRGPAFPEGFMGAKPHRQYGYLHWFNLSTKTQEKDYVPDIARVFAGAHRLGFEFIGTYGELRADTLVADRNYRAQVAWARQPELSLDAFQ